MNNLRDEIAMSVLPTLFSRIVDAPSSEAAILRTSEGVDSNYELAAVLAYRQADAMLKIRDGDVAYFTPNNDQLRSLLEGLSRTSHIESQYGFLRTWIRDFAIHKAKGPAK